MPRHVPKAALGKLAAQLSDWMSLSKSIIAQVDDKIAQLQHEEQLAAQRQRELNARVAAELQIHDGAQHQQQKPGRNAAAGAAASF